MAKLVAPRFENSGSINVVGIRTHYACGGDPNIPAQWQKLEEMMPLLPPQKHPVVYGICFDRPDGLDYLAGIEVADDAVVRDGVSKGKLPARRYAVFEHGDHVSALPETCAAIFGDWAPRSGVELIRESDGALVFLERYGPGFDYRTGRGDIEVWIPIR
jgi:AraC family transcriptional regulator